MAKSLPEKTRAKKSSPMRTYKHVEATSSHIAKVSQSLDLLIFSRARSFEKGLTRKRIAIASSTFVALIVMGSFLAPKGAAESAQFYPTSCLGGWMNPGMAEGQSQTTANDRPEDFNPDNSAILAANTQADMYCGGFKGDFPEKTKPTKILVSLSWTTGENINHAKAIIGSSFASSSKELLDGTSSESVSFTLATSTPVEEVVPATAEIPSEEGDKKIEAASTSTEVSPEATSTSSFLGGLFDQIKTVMTGGADDTPVADPALPSAETTPVEVAPTETAPTEQPEQPVSLLDRTVYHVATTFIMHAYAEEVAEAVIAEAPSAPVAESVVESVDNVALVAPAVETVQPETLTSPESETVASEAKLQPEETLEVATTSSDTMVASTTVSEVVEPVAEHVENSANPFLEVLYTFDGITWASLGKISEADMQSRNFEVPITDATTWDDMSHLQIKVQAIVRLDATPAVYLDGIKAEVMYDIVNDGSHPDFTRDTVLQETKDGGVHAVLITNFETEQNEIWYQLTEPLEGFAIATSTWFPFSDLRTWPTKETIIYSLVDHSPPGLSKHVYDKELVIDPKATHSCRASEFRVDISGMSTSSANIFFKEDEQAIYKAEIGSLPEGVKVTFARNGLYEDYPSQDDTSLSLQIVNEDGSTKGDFTVPIIFTKNLGHESTVLCQVNLINL
jgi:hypothetical protein